MTAGSLIEAKGLTFSYRKELLLRDISFAVTPGEYVALIGDNGVGKSTLLRLLLGELEPDGGTARIMGQEAARFRGKPTVGYVPQSAMALAEGFPATAGEIVSQGMYRGVGRWMPARERNKRMAEALELVEMGAYRDRMIGKLSGGQVQRVMIARALAGESGLLILDEPTSGVDSETALSLYRLLAGLAAERALAVLMVTHDTTRIRAYATRVLRLSGGALEEE